MQTRGYKLNGATDVYTYDAANKLQSVAGSVSKAYTYDSAGNVTAVTSGTGTTNLAWDGAGRVTNITFPNSNSNVFAYNGLSQRVGKLDSGGQFGYMLADDSIDANVLADGQASYQYGAGLVSEVRGGVSKAYHADALGTTRAMSNSAGTVTDALETDAFGNTVSKTGSSASPFGFAGQSGYQTDADSGLMRLGYRFYDASVGRFLSRDPIQDGYNWYIYCNNDPVNAVDPEGLRAWGWVKKAWSKIRAWADEVVHPAPRRTGESDDLLLGGGPDGKNEWPIPYDDRPPGGPVPGEIPPGGGSSGGGTPIVVVVPPVSIEDIGGFVDPTPISDIVEVSKEVGKVIEDKVIIPGQAWNRGRVGGNLLDGDSGNDY